MFAVREQLSPKALGLLLITVVTFAGTAPALQASIIACKLVPRPLINTANRQTLGALVNDNASITCCDFTKGEYSFSMLLQ